MARILFDQFVKFNAGFSEAYAMRILIAMLVLVLASLACSFPFSPAPTLDYSLFTPSPGAIILTETPPPPTDTPIPPTATIDPNAPIAFAMPTIAPTQFYTGAACPPDKLHQVSFEVKVEGPAVNIKVVEIFIRVYNTLTGEVSDWRGPFDMKPLGGGRYSYLLTENKLPELTADNFLLQFQFVVVDPNNKVTARSEVYKNLVSLVVCR
jgi:hypothetical protein